MTEQNTFNNNINIIGTFPLNNDLSNQNQLNNNNNSQLNNYNNLPSYMNSNLNINNLLLLNTNNNVSNINLNNQNSQEINNFNNNQKNITYQSGQNNYYNKSNNNHYQSGNNNKQIKPYFTSKHILLKSPSIAKVDELIYKDVQQIEKILSNYKFYIINNNFEAINICLKYIEYTNFFFNQVITNKITDNIKKIMFSNNSDETIKYKLKEVLKKMIPFNIRENYLREFYNSKGDKSLYNLFKRDLNLYKGSDDKIYYLFEIYETVKYKLNNKDREELKNIFNKYSYGYNNQNINNNNIYNNNYFNETSMNKNGGNYLNSNNNYNHNLNGSNYNKYRKNSYQYNDNNWNDNNYSSTNNYHHHSSYNNHNYQEDKNNDELGYNKNYDAHHNSSYHKKNNNFKGSYSSRHYYNEKNGNKMKGKTNRKNSAFGSGAVLVEVSTTPKKEDNDNENDNINTNNNNDISQEKKDEVKKDILENNVNNVIINSTNVNDMKDINDINEDKKEEFKIPEKENIIVDNNNIEKEEGNLLVNEINISQDMEKEANKDKENINNDIENDNNYNNNINNEENNENFDVNIEFNNGNENDLKDENIITDFNSINPFNEKRNDENERSEKGDSSNNLKVIHNDEMDNPSNNKEDEVTNENDINDNNDYILNITDHPDNIFNNINLFENNNNINQEVNHFEQLNNMNNINNDKEVDYNNNKEDEIKENFNINMNNNDIINDVKNENEIKNNPLLNSSPKKELIFNNSINNINENIYFNKKSVSDNNQKNLINNINQTELNNFSDINLMNLNSNSFPKVSNNINWNNNNLSKEQLQLFGTIMQNNNLQNYNPFLNQNLFKTNLNNNTFQNQNNIGMNILNNINQGMNLLNLINDTSMNINNNTGNGLLFHNNDNQKYINIFFNYLDEEQNLISSLKPISKGKNNQYNNQYNNYQINTDYLQNRADKLTYEYKNKIKKLKEKNPLLVKENMNLFEEKIILPIYQKISEENQQRKAIYTEVYDKYKNIIMKILEKNNVGDIKVEPYGSIVNNFMTEYGDIDICIELKDHNLLKDFDNYLEEIREEAVDEQKCATFIILEKYSKFLILKLKDIESEIDLDITVQNILPIENTKLIRLYSLYDQRFHILGIFLKFWVKKNHIHGALDKFLSSYALLILIIHYLQTIIEPKILPILQQVKNEKKECVYFNGEKEITTNIYFEEDLDKAKNYMKIINNNEENESNVVELLIGFFEHYSYSYDHYMISISRSDKIPTEEMETIAFPIEDPFDIGYNPGKSMKLNTLSYAAFTYCMRKELNNILLGTYFKNSKEE